MQADRQTNKENTDREDRQIDEIIFHTPYDKFHNFLKWKENIIRITNVKLT